MNRRLAFIMVGLLLLAWWFFDTQITLGKPGGSLEVTGSITVYDETGKAVLSISDVKQGTFIQLDAARAATLRPGATYTCRSKFTITVSISTDDPRPMTYSVDVSWSGDASGSRSVGISFPSGTSMRTMSTGFDVTPPDKTFYVDYYKSGSIGHKIAVTATFHLPPGPVVKNGGGETRLDWKAMDFTYSASVGVIPTILSIYEFKIPGVGYVVDVRLLMGLAMTLIGLVMRRTV
ncbi:MAG: hypothetical protein FGF50_08620 [Candidatus Brockarchaeota archaeon]|nr:hypothetical protein [Candidatus Brockarchaeota archaeon]